MSYEIIISPNVQKDLKKFDSNIQKRFFKKIEKLREYPKLHGKPLRRPLTGRWELRFEKRWRIIYIIDDRENNVKISAILHKDDF